MFLKTTMAVMAISHTHLLTYFRFLRFDPHKMHFLRYNPHKMHFRHEIYCI